MSKFAEQWLVDPNTISKAIQFLPTELYEKLNETAQKILDYKGQTNQSIVCKLYQNPLNQGLSGDMLNQLAKDKEPSSNLRQLLALSENNHNGTLQRHYETIDHKLAMDYRRPKHFFQYNNQRRAV